MDKNLSTGFYEVKLAKSANTSGTEWATPVTLFGQGVIIWDNDGTTGHGGLEQIDPEPPLQLRHALAQRGRGDVE